MHLMPSFTVQVIEPEPGLFGTAVIIVFKSTTVSMVSQAFGLAATGALPPSNADRAVTMYILTSAKQALSED